MRGIHKCFRYQILPIMIIIIIFFLGLILLAVLQIHISSNADEICGAVPVQTSIIIRAHIISVCFREKGNDMEQVLPSSTWRTKKLKENLSAIGSMKHRRTEEFSFLSHADFLACQSPPHEDSFT